MAVCFSPGHPPAWAYSPVARARLGHPILDAVHRLPAGIHPLSRHRNPARNPHHLPAWRPRHPYAVSQFQLLSPVDRGRLRRVPVRSGGRGLSDRTEDISEYTLARNIADLEAIRQAIGAEKMILIGTSWGGVLAAQYLAVYPDQVARAVLISPGVLGDRSEVKYDYKTTASSDDDSVILPSLRFIVAGALARIQPGVAEQFASQEEMGVIYDTFTTSPNVDYQTNCKGYQPPANTSTRSGGSNYYANLLTLASLKTALDPRPILQNNPTPVLILRGECDYIPLEATMRYKETLPNAVFVPVPGAGHAVTSAQPELSLVMIRAFLSGAPMPNP
ncbi:MAG: alpha/beta hydrolase [Anaerolineae bacterium]|nr:alpha/beta hydrolase [Anaerolineae bacterium]